MSEPVFEVFARKAREEPLRHIGDLNAPDGELARVYAWKTYDEQNWFEMWVVPRASVLAVSGPRAASPDTSAAATAGSGADVASILRATGGGGYGGAEVVVEEAHR